jgi:hypothetical protein
MRELVDAIKKDANRYLKGECSYEEYLRLHKHADALKEILERPVVVGAGEVRLWDTQWINIVNHDNCYRDWSKDDAIAHAVKMTEKAIARNVADGKLPPREETTESMVRGKS